MKVFSRLAMVIGLSLFTVARLTAAGPASGSSTASDSSVKSVAADTPEATFDAMKGAAAKKDWAGFSSGLTSESQDLMIGALGMMSMMPGGPDAEKMKGLTETMTKHGAKPIGLPDILATAGDQAKVMALLGKVGADVKDKPACIGDAMIWIEKNMDKDSPMKANFKPDEITASTLSDVKIDGDMAKAKVKAKDGKTEDVDFKKVEGKWYMDMAAKAKAGK